MDCRECSIEGSNNNLCESCDIKNNYYPLYNDTNVGTFKCFNKMIEGYFLNKEKKLYEKCYNTCKYCFRSGNDSFHNCIECSNNYKFMNGINCYENYSYYYYVDQENKYHSTNEYECPENYKLIEDKNLCINNCSKDTDYKYEFNNKCYNICPFNSNSSENNEYICECKKYYNYNRTECIEEIPEGYYLKNGKLKSIEKCDEKCQKCSNESVYQNNLCISCNINNGYYPILNEYEYDSSFINCYNETPIGYYLINNSYKLDRRCDVFENIYFNYFMNNYLYFFNLTNYDCPAYYYCDSYNNYFCTLENKCPLNYSKLIRNKKKCIDNCTKDSEFIYEYKNECYISCPKWTNISYNNIYLCEDIIKNGVDCNPIDFFTNKCKLNTNNTTSKDQLINNIKEEITNGGMDELITNVIQNNKTDLIINEDNTLFQITSTENQKNNKYNNISSIILGECETILKKIYGINENTPLLIFKIDYYQPNSQIPIIGYEVYHPLNKSRLDLNHCKNANINFNIPVSINENDLFKYDPESEYYKDDCFPATTEKDTDILVNDRQNEFNENNMSLCENGCTFTGYETDTKTAQCECGIKNKDLVISELMNQSDILYYNFTSKEETSNLITMKCYYTLFTKKGLENNIGSYLLLFTIFLFLCSGILYYKCGYNLMEDDIKEIIRKKEKKEKYKNEINIKETIGERVAKRSLTKKSKGKKKKMKIKKSKKGKKNKVNLILSNMNNNSKSIIKLKNENSMNYGPNNINSNIDKNIKTNNESEFCDYELNSMSYKEALKYDKRKFFSYYISLIKTKNYFLFAFYPIKDYNSKIVKISLFFLFFSIFYFINALFFDEKTIHKIYEDEGLYNFVYLVPHIFSSFAISYTLNTIIKYIFLSERNICTIKGAKTMDILYDIVDKIKRRLVIKYICYFCGSIVFLCFFWYYLSSFGAVYQNTQTYLIKNTLISFAVSLVYPFIINILGIMRIIALKKGNKEKLYKISKIINFI